MMQLRSYQERAVRDIYAQICRRQSRVCLELATGGGKTAIMAELLRYPLRQAVVTHRRILLEQIARTLEQCGIRYGMRASGYKPEPSAQVQLCMVQSELRRAAKHGIAEGIDVLHVDELHTVKGPQYQGVFNRYVDAGASLVGYTATPSDLGGLVESVYRVATVPELIEQGFLCPPRLFSCGQPDVRLLEKLRRDSVGEFLPADVNKLVKPQIIFGKVLEHLKRLNPDGRPFVLFAHSVKASLWWAQMLTAKGIPTAHIDGDDVWVDGSLYKSDSIKRAAIFERLTNGSLFGVSNRFVLREGWDCPAVGHAILTAPVGRRQTWVQMCGRVLRPYPGREYAVIQDHSGSYLNHPPLDSGEPWDWEAPAGLPEKTRIAEMRHDKEIEPIVCPRCFAVRYAGPSCPQCGFRFDRHARFVIQSDGELKLIEGKAYRPRTPRPKPGDDQLWERLYWATTKNSNRTAEQAYVWYAKENGWRWLKRDLPLMPKNEADWFIPLKNVPKSELY